jgi:hypothetical protein
MFQFAPMSVFLPCSLLLRRSLVDKFDKINRRTSHFYAAQIVFVCTLLYSPSCAFNNNWSVKF